MSKLKGYKTVLVNFLTILAIGLSAIVQGPGDIDPRFLEVAGMVLGIVNLVLRFVTNTPIFTKPPTEPPAA